MKLYRTIGAVLFALLASSAVAADEPATDAPAAEAPRLEFYSSASCGYCKALRKWLQARNISYIEHNINETLATREAFYASGAQGTPLVVIGECRIQGFNPFAISAALEADSGC